MTDNLEIARVLDAAAVDRRDWYWCGYPGHFIAAARCCFHLHTRVGKVIVSTVGDYRPDGEDAPARNIGCDRQYETYVFVAKDTERPEGEPLTWGEIDSFVSNDSEESERQHYEMCERWATAEKQADAATLARNSAIARTGGEL